MYGKSNMETYITICKIESQREFAVWQKKRYCKGASNFVKNILLHVVRDRLRNQKYKIILKYTIIK